ncbi:MAG: DUF1499 domain-containing protein [Pseudomonadota bacterium]
MNALIWCLSGLSLFLGLFALGLGPAARVGLITHGDGIGLLLGIAIPVALCCLGCLLAVGLATWRYPALLGLTIACLVPSLVATAGLLHMKLMVDSYPLIHDITTDPENPPQIIAGVQAPRSNPSAYNRDEAVPQHADDQTLYAAQKAGFPEIETLTLPMNSLTVQTQVTKAFEAMGLDIQAVGPVAEGTETIRIEATDTSRWFGFIDDVVVRIIPLSPTESQVDIRSKSRIGMSDLGANGNRVLAIMNRLRPPSPDS